MKMMWFTEPLNASDAGTGARPTQPDRDASKAQRRATWPHAIGVLVIRGKMVRLPPFRRGFELQSCLLGRSEPTTMLAGLRLPIG